jgi:hypothetical protein
MMSISDYPHQNASHRKRMHKEVHKAAYPEIHDKFLTSEEAAERIKRILNGR